jgi:hypothetical protein
MNIGGLGTKGSTLHKHCARLNTQQIDVYCKETRIPGMKPVVQVTQSITDECNKMIKQELMDNLYLNKVDANADLWQANYEQVKQTRSKWIVTDEENAPLIKTMFRKILRRKLQEKRPVTNMYGVVVIS